MKLFYIILIGFIFYGCESRQRKQEDRKDSIAESKLVNSSEEAVVTQLKSNIGKYPKQEHLFAKEPLQARLKSVLGDEFEDFNKYWNTETPIKKEGSVLHTSGCKAHDCALNSYDFYFDLSTNTINVYHIKNGKEKIYKENDKEIELPKGYAEEIKIKRQNASLEVLPPRLR